MCDDEDTSGGSSGNTSDNEGGYDSSGSYLDIDESCTSSIDFCYSEEDKYQYDSETYDTCDGDISAAISEQGIPDLEMVYSGWEDESSSWEEDGSKKYFQFNVGERKIVVSCGGTVTPTLYHSTDDECDSELSEAVEAPKLPCRAIWKESWPKEKSKKNLAVNVYAYYKKGKCFGGHAVIVRDMSALPIAASAYFTRFGMSYLHHVLVGLEVGLDLALKHGCSSPTMLCNSRLVAQLLRKVASEGFCHCNNNMVGTICVECTWKTVPHLSKVYLKNLAPFIETIQRKRGCSTIEWDSGKNEAVHYLAKLAKSNSLYHGYRFESLDMEKPEDYPDELVDILLKDAYNIDERIGNVVSKASTTNGNVSNSNITANAGIEVVLSTREEVMTSGEGVKSMAEKGQGGDDVVNSSVGDKNGDKAISVGNSIANATNSEFECRVTANATDAELRILGDTSDGNAKSCK